ncbi:C1q-like domain-containing protein [Fictibacillus barbaricus]|uniref:C1q domain-containing protein n=1 Tax=Fictibacillus barbaricus TaxID=182136 RepID=A0ABS2ZGJ2_9BACL|nr:hypothetical protein [Fictibacillus barbaricus]MBN3546886.1 hypothetical protein [Fictibacillus barbaricus]GGB44597.1 hypothetical protein GCM10007199_07530 [Fictibacillus barbaricus]
MTRYDHNDWYGVRPLGSPRPLVGKSRGCKSDKSERCGCNSAFRAIKTVGQQVLQNVPTQVLYPVEQYDTNNEYDPATSTFIPKQSGVYSIIASILVSSSPDVSFRINIRVNGNDVASDNENSTITQLTGLSVSTNIRLQAGDRVQVFAEVPQFSILVGDEAFSHFEATRIG